MRFFFLLQISPGKTLKMKIIFMKRPQIFFPTTIFQLLIIFMLQMSPFSFMELVQLVKMTFLCHWSQYLLVKMMQACLTIQFQMIFSLHFLPLQSLRKNFKTLHTLNPTHKITHKQTLPCHFLQMWHQYCTFLEEQSISLLLLLQQICHYR